MFRKNFPFFLFAVSILSGTGCGSSPQQLPYPKLSGAPERLALGATVEAGIVVYSGEAEVSSADPTIVAVESPSPGGVVLRGVGVGKTTVSVQQDDRAVDYSVEVAAPTRFEVLLGNPLFAEVPLQGKAIRALELQHVVVLIYDEEGLLVGRGLAEISMPAGISECQNGVGSWYEAVCWQPAPGPQSIRVTVNEKEQLIEITAVADDEIIELVLVHEEERDAEPGQLIRVDALGVTEDETMVYGMQASSLDWMFFPMVYEYDPDADVALAQVRAAGLTQELRFRGWVTYEPLLWENQ